jgi:protein-disulfide isomerase
VQIHPNAGNAGAAAICAGEQDKFWEMHDLLFARQGEWQDIP